MTAWTDKLKNYQKEHKCFYKEAMIKCSSNKTKKRPPRPRVHKITGKINIELVGDGIGLGDAERSASLQKLINEHGNATIISLIVVREPVESRKLINIISLGQFDKNINTLGYDTIFHTSLNFQLSDGTEGNIEKHETIIVGPLKTVGDSLVSTIRSPVPLSQAIHTLEQLYGDKTYRYSALDANCQDFVIGFLSASNGLSTKLQKFVRQDAKSLMNNMNSYFYRFITDIARKYRHGVLA